MHTWAHLGRVSLNIPTILGSSSAASKRSPKFQLGSEASKEAQKRLMTRSPTSSAAPPSQSPTSSTATEAHSPASSAAPDAQSAAGSAASAAQVPASSAAPAIQSPAASRPGPISSAAPAAASAMAPPVRWSPRITPPTARAPPATPTAATLAPVLQPWFRLAKASTVSPFSGTGTAILEPGLAPGGTATWMVCPGLLGSFTVMFWPAAPAGTVTMMVEPGGISGLLGALMP
mmetsp:Transcript_8650/g.18924  ORF Transcript_8650/g.18924 Transcript_8650/m.18924 type:complete len:232 (-) Transcript_8650:422-1117(-)